MGESVGVLTGAGLATFGRRRLVLLSPIVFAALGIAGGFAEVAAVLISIRGVMGLCAGIFVTALLGMIIDIFVTRRSRTAAFAAVICVAVAGQLAGPWIAVLVLKLLPW